ncbi:hypothetical protein [Streptomyces sp. NPDC002644]
MLGDAVEVLADPRALGGNAKRLTVLVVPATVWCPRCDQGWVVRRRVRGRGRDAGFLVCRECDTVWERGLASNRGPFPLLEEHLGRLGVEPRWTSLDRVGCRDGAASA